MLSIYKLDVAEALQLGFQDAASPVMEEIVNFHNEVMIYLTFILIGVL
jgi:heme/copper-type cytochrome/quinol oxidase subunit 2|tara:strand:- start:297 stop:440 length:144 start_codon:yes stop_codon:yes gene_type:complete